MFVGHECLAFALAGWGARRAGRDARTALALAGVAALAALLPDLDVAYAVATYAAAVAGGVPLGWEAFWGVANRVHRVVTHPLPVGAAATLAFGAGHLAVGRTRRSDPSPSAVVTAAVALLAGLAILWGFRSTVRLSAAVVAAAFLLVAAVVGAAVARRTSLPPTATMLAAGVGFLTHPFGDVFLASPPPLLSPFGPPLLTERVVLAVDPTLNLLGVLFVEVAAVWAAVAVYARLASPGGSPTALRDAVDPRAGLGLVYAPAAVVLPRPTIADAHVLGFTIVPLALLVGGWIWLSGRGDDGIRSSARPDGDPRFVAIVGALTALTVAAAGYLVAYAAA
ncbi:metal-dependent hydrolase [Halobellus sp. EA9]|uniref:metal-dependent hydrolase n=1 Tax=Halobellus sp. EA9 TaxID=3421647 RepID=UPI003EB9D781